MILPLPYSYCKLNKVTLTNEKDHSILHVCGTLNPNILSSIQKLFKETVEKKTYNDDDFESLLTDLYTNQSDDLDFSEFDNLDLADIANSISPSDDLLDDKNKAPIIKLINATITKAIKTRASDIHLEPFENKLNIRFRVDGVLREVLQ